MLLRTKVVLILSTVVALYAAVDHLGQRVLIAPSFDALERVEAVEDLRRTTEALAAEIEHLDGRCQDWAAWDDTWRFVEDGNQAFVDTNLSRTSLLGAHVDLLFLCKPGGEVVWADIHEPGGGAQIQLRDMFPRGSLAPTHPLLAENTRPGRELGPEHGRVAGLVMTAEGPMLVASRPILRSSGSGPPRGTVIMGRFLGERMIDEVARRTRVQFAVWPLDGAGMPERERGFLDQVTSSPEGVVAARDAELLDVYGTFPDIQAAPALLIRASVDRAISMRGATAIRYALISTLAAGLLLLLVLLCVLQKTVLQPIALLTDHAVDMGRREHATGRLDLRRDDEIGILASEFDDMLDKLARSRAAVVEVARAAGKSEIATGILHNVGNVLNTVNVSASLVADRVRNSRVPKLQRLAGVAEQHGPALGDFLVRDPKGKHFGPYLSELAKLMATDQESIARELDTLNAGIEHIRQLVDSQQTYARRSELREPALLSQVIDDALRISEQALPEARPAQILRRFDELPPLAIDRHKLLEVLVNLCKNARESMQRAQCASPVITARLRRIGADRISIEITDNGEGIPEDSLVRIFHHGFTTHRAGHGFGLHGAANSVTEMGGKLAAASDGPGRGATFTLELPVEVPQEV
jgi:two-component system NtrC family sensor kinase